MLLITLLLFYFTPLTNIDYEQSSTMSRLDLAISMQHYISLTELQK